MTMELTDTAGMSAPTITQLAAVRTELELQRTFRVQQIEEVEVDAAEALAAGDEARLQVTRSLFMAAEAALQEINAALVRLDGGTYGTCERCHSPSRSNGSRSCRPAAPAPPVRRGLTSAGSAEVPTVAGRSPDRQARPPARAGRPSGSPHDPAQHLHLARAVSRPGSAMS
jgi:hypothetical protein